MFYKSILNVVGVVVAVMLVGCVDNGVDPNGPNNNGGGGGNYTYTGRTITINGQVWMAENLNRATANSKCYDDDASNCAKYGRLYTWADAKNACPAGWHFPSDAEWTMLTDAVGGAFTAGTKLKSTSGWGYDGNGTDDYGFSALPGGYGYSRGYFGAGYDGSWWGDTESVVVDGDTVAWYRNMLDYDSSVVRYRLNTGYLFSVRCVQN